MIRWPLLLSLFAAPVLAHDTPADDHPTPNADSRSAREVATEYLRHLLEINPRDSLPLSLLPFQLEDRRIASADELLQEWLKVLRPKRMDLVTLYGVDVYTPQEMEKKYGKPPARLKGLAWTGPKTMIAVGNLSGHPAVLVLKQQPDGWKVAAYTD